MPVRYEYNWNPLVGCLQGLLRAAGLPHDAARVSAVSGEAFRLPSLAAEPRQPAFAAGADHPRDLSALADDLALLGLRARVDVWDLRSGRPPLLGRRLGRRLRRALADGRAAAVSGVAGGDFGLLVGYDGERRGLSGRRSAERGDRRLAAGGPRPGPGRGLAGGRDPRGGDARGPGGRGRGSCDARSRISATPAARNDLRDWVAVLRSAVEIDAPGHARAAQALAAASGEAARFYRQAAAEGVAEAAPLAGPAADLALALSRFATLFPFPWRRRRRRWGARGGGAVAADGAARRSGAGGRVADAGRRLESRLGSRQEEDHRAGTRAHVYDAGGAVQGRSSPSSTSIGARG